MGFNPTTTRFLVRHSISFKSGWRRTQTGYGVGTVVPLCNTHSLIALIRICLVGSLSRRGGGEGGGGRGEGGGREGEEGREGGEERGGRGERGRARKREI